MRPHDTRAEAGQVLGVDLRPVEGWPGYWVSANGEVFSTRRSEQPRRMRPGWSGSTVLYQHVVLCHADTGARRVARVHDLVLIAWVGPRSPGTTASHRDGDSGNNRASNLLWETQAENLARKQAHGTTDRGVRNSRASLSAQDVRAAHKMRAAGAKQQQIATTLGVSRTTISRVLSGQRYQEVM